MNKNASCLHVVLIEPEIPQNTGNIGRTCVGFNAELHLVGELGFKLDEKSIKRSGLDYWPKLKCSTYVDWKSFSHGKDARQFVFLSTRGKKCITDMPVIDPLYLVFGSESRGLPPSFYKTYKNQLFKIPMAGPIRSLNLATSVGIAAHEAARRPIC